LFCLDINPNTHNVANSLTADDIGRYIHSSIVWKISISSYYGCKIWENSQVGCGRS